MKILLDECVPWPLSRLLEGHACSNPCKQGGAGIKNGELLELAEREFDLFITSDQNFRYQQNLTGRKIAILELSSNDWYRIRSDAETIRAMISTIKATDFIQLAVA